MDTLSPDKDYTLIMESTYKIDETEYTKNFIHKTFRTPILGLTLNKDVFTSNSLSFNINFDYDSQVKSFDISLIDPNGEEVSQKRSVQNEAGKQKKVEFEGLTPDKEYIIKLSNVALSNAATQEYKTYEYTYKTLKKLHRFEDGELSTNITVNKNVNTSITISLFGAFIKE